MKHTSHSRIRSRQRAISDKLIEIALTHGRPSHTHGDVCYLLDDRSLRGTPYQRQTAELRGLKVILTADGQIRTVKWDYRIRRRPGQASGATVR